MINLFRARVLPKQSDKNFLFWLANRILIVHTLLTLLGIVWAEISRQWLLAGIMLVLWLLAFRLWAEWKADETPFTTTGDIHINENR